MNIPPKVIVVAGPTASGKTRLAIELAGLYMGEICEEFFKMGFKDILLYMGHGGTENYKALKK